MTMNTILKPTLVLCFILLCHFRASFADDDDDVDVGFNYRVGSRKGPPRWGQLRPEWVLCGTGTMQSPIAISDATVTLNPALGPLQTAYVSAPATLDARGSDVQILWGGAGGAGTLTIAGTPYILFEAHWHKPAEHTINGIRHALELHLVHRSAAGQTAVVAVLYRIGAADPFINSLITFIDELEDDEGEILNVGSVNPNNIFSGTNINYYRYMGSLTTPPCSENVIWTIRENIQTVTRRQIRALEEANDNDDFERNARPLQPLNGRIVSKFVQP